MHNILLFFQGGAAAATAVNNTEELSFISVFKDNLFAAGIMLCLLVMSITAVAIFIRIQVGLGNISYRGSTVFRRTVNAIFKDMTGKQAAVIFELLKGESQQGVAARFKKSKSTISQHVSAGRWYEIEKLLQQYQNIIHQIN